MDATGNLRRSWRVFRQALWSWIAQRVFGAPTYARHKRKVKWTPDVRDARFRLTAEQRGYVKAQIESVGPPHDAIPDRKHHLADLPVDIQHARERAARARKLPESYTYGSQMRRL